MHRRFGDRLAIEQPLAYARRAIVNANISWSRRRSSTEVLTAADLDRPVLDADPGSADGLWQLLGRLPHRQRVVLVMRYYLGYSDAEIAETLGCRRGTVRSLASRALADLRTSRHPRPAQPLRRRDEPMSAAEPDDLERRLTELFNQRAATVTQVRPIDLGPAGGTRKARRARAGQRPPASAQPRRAGSRGSGVRGDRRHRPGHPGPPAPAGGAAAERRQPPDSRPTSNPTATSTDKPSNPPCLAAAPPSWRRAITAGAVPLDRQLNQVISANGSTGEYLVVQGNPAPPRSSAELSDVELSLFHGSTGRTIYLPAEKDNCLRRSNRCDLSRLGDLRALAYPEPARLPGAAVRPALPTGGFRSLTTRGTSPATGSSAPQ